jgi:hypothetical protein
MNAMSQVRAATPLDTQIRYAQAWLDMTRDLAARAVAAGRSTEAAAAASVRAAEDVVTTLRQA